VQPPDRCARIDDRSIEDIDVVEARVDRLALDDREKAPAYFLRILRAIHPVPRMEFAAMATKSATSSPRSPR
jgi:hypothetical protein